MFFRFFFALSLAVFLSAPLYKAEAGPGDHKGVLNKPPMYSPSEPYKYDFNFKDILGTDKKQTKPYKHPIDTDNN